jgi:hypothetical protein
MVCSVLDGPGCADSRTGSMMMQPRCRHRHRRWCCSTYIPSVRLVPPDGAIAAGALVNTPFVSACKCKGGQQLNVYTCSCLRAHP